MSTKRTRFLLMSMVVLLMLIVCLGLVPLSQFAYAEQHIDVNLHKQTKIYSKTFSSDYYSGCEDYDNYKESSPSITFFTHGLASEASAWSNAGSGSLQYNSHSIIAAICDKLGDEVDLYYANCQNKSQLHSFDLYKLDLYDYSYNNKKTAYIDDVSKHIVVLFESSVPEEGNQVVYEQFDYVVDSISLQYKKLSGVLPRINLVGHSRGGLTNIQYATEHPYNVAAVFSMGTPYNGAILGQIDVVMSMLGPMASFNGTYDIMDPSLAVDMRNKWNEAYAPDVNMNVVALGSMADLSFIRAFIQDAKSYEDYENIAEKIEPLLNFIVQFAEENPQTVNNIVEVIDGIMLLLQRLNVEPSEIIASKLEKYINNENFMRILNSFTIENVRDILSLLRLVNGEIVLADDLFIDLDSQLGWGFDDGIEYNGFKRYVKTFTASDINEHRASPNQPAVIHNLETMNDGYVDIIKNSLIFGHGQPATDLTDEMSGNTVQDGRVFNFAPESSGTRVFTTNGANIALYKYNQNNCIELIKLSSNNLSYYFEGNERYLIIIDQMGKTQVLYSFTVDDKFIFGSDNAFSLKKGESSICYLQVTESGYYKVSSSSPNVSIELNGSTVDSTVYLKQGEKNLIVVRNTSSNAITANVSISNVKPVSLEENFQNTSNNKVVSFTNPYNVEINFQLTLNSTSDEVKRATIHFADNSTRSSTVGSGNKRITTFNLYPNEKCFIVFSDWDGSVTANIGIKQKQLKWVIKNGNDELPTRQLERGKEYDVRLYLMSDNIVVKEITDFIFPESDNYTFYSNKLRINAKAELEYDIVITPISEPDAQLVIDIILNREEINYTITLDEADDEGNTRDFTAHYNKPYPTITKPTRKGHDFLGYYLIEGNTKTLVYDSNANCCFNKYPYETNITLVAEWKEVWYTLTIKNTIGKSDRTFMVKKDYSLPDYSEISFEVIGYSFVGIYSKPNGTETRYYEMCWFDDQVAAKANYEAHCYSQCAKRIGKDDLTFDRDYVLYAHYKKATADCICYNKCDGNIIESYPSKTYNNLIHGNNTIEAPSIDGYEFVSFAYGTDISYTQTATFNIQLSVNRNTASFYSKKTLVAIYNKTCVAQGTLITLADGSQVPVESLKGDEMLMVWNLITGRLESAPILFIDRDSAQVYKVINLGFSDGTTVKVISEHGFWDYNLNKYVYLRQDASKYIGHYFNKGDARVQLTSVDVRDEYTTAYSPVTYGHLCYYVNGMLSMPGGIDGLFNIFEVNPDTMTIDPDAMLRDINQYGLFTYDEFAELVPVSEDVFNAFNGQYLKVAIGKGLITVEQLNNLASRYAEFFV